MLASAWKQKRQEISKEKLRRGFGRPSKSAEKPATRKFRAEVEELKLRTKCNRRGNVGHSARECPPKRVQGCKGGATQRGKTKRLHSVTGAHSMNRVFCVSLRVSTVLCWKGFANAENSVVHCWRKRRNRGWSVNVSLVSSRQC